jgi:outer membrane lipoprotein-sorting protein
VKLTSGNLTTKTRRHEELFFVVVAVMCLASAGFAQTAKTPSLDEIVARHVQARGGAEKLKSLQSLRTVGTLSLGSRGEARLTREIKRPHLVRTDFALGNVTLIHAYDGQSGWQTGPDGKTSELTGDDLKNAEEDADIEGPLVDYKQKGNKLEVAGTSSVNSAACYRLKLTYANGDVAYLCLDAKTYLVVGQRVERNGQVQVEAVLGDYRPYGGIQFAGTSDIKQSTNPEPIHYKLEKVEINPEIDDSRFHMPPSQEPQ